MAFVDDCPPIVVERVMREDLSSSDSAGLFSWVADNAPLDCQVQAVIAVANRMDKSSHPQVIGDFCSSVATYARFMTPMAIEQITHAYLRFPYAESVAASYFLGLRETKIDIRSHLTRRVEIDWSFEHPRKDAATWHYYLYLASLGDQKAIAALGEKLASTENGNDLANLLESLNEVEGEDVTRLLKAYENDMRRDDGTEGPGMLISDNVRYWLSLRQ